MRDGIERFDNGGVRDGIERFDNGGVRDGIERFAQIKKTDLVQSIKTAIKTYYLIHEEGGSLFSGTVPAESDLTI